MSPSGGFRSIPSRLLLATVPLGTWLGRGLQQPKEQSIPALAIVASLIAHGGEIA